MHSYLTLWRGWCRRGGGGEEEGYFYLGQHALVFDIMEGVMQCNWLPWQHTDQHFKEEPGVFEDGGFDARLNNNPLQGQFLMEHLPPENGEDKGHVWHT